MKRLFLLALGLIALPAFASAPVIPETTISVSILELFPDLALKPAPRKAAAAASTPKLPADFGTQVASRIENNRAFLISCLASQAKGTQAAAHYEAKILIEPSGKGQVGINAVQGKDGESPLQAAVPCIQSVLRTIEYPKHSLSAAVQVTLPLVLAKEKL